MHDFLVAWSRQYTGQALLATGEGSGWHFARNTPGTRIVNKMQIVIHGDGHHAVELRHEGDTVWLNQGQMAELFGRARSVIARHIRHTFKEGERDASAVCAKFAHTAPDGKTYQVEFYNLDVIISVGCRPAGPTSPEALSLKDARIAIGSLREALERKGEATTLFARERNEALSGMLAAAEQTMSGEPLYASAQVRAAHILYFITQGSPLHRRQ